MYGVSVQDNEYHQGKETDVNQQIKDTVALQDVTTLAAASVQNAEDEDIVKNVTNTVTEDEDGTRTSKNTLDAAIGLTAAVDQFGHYLLKGEHVLFAVNILILCREMVIVHLYVLQKIYLKNYRNVKR